VTGLDLRVDRLAITVDVPVEHRHRIEPVVRRALVLFEALAPGELVRLGASARTVRVESLAAAEIAVDLARDSDEDVARRIARGWLDALRRVLA
jgi:hypothetical protein